MGKTRKGYRVLRAILTQRVHAAVRRRQQRAIIAVAHSIRKCVLHMLTRHEPSHELGANYFDERRRQYTVDRLISRSEHPADDEH